MLYLILNDAPPQPAPVVPDGEPTPEPPTQAELNRRRAEDVSAKIWEMTMPDTSGNVTKRYTGYIQHPDGRVALQIHGEASQQVIDGETITTFSDALRVHPDANVDALAEAITGAVTAQEKANIKAGLATRKGSSASLLGFAMSTQSLSKRLKTQEQMEADGWFPAPKI